MNNLQKCCWKKNKKITVLYLFGVLSVCLAALLGAALGSTAISAKEFLYALQNGLETTAAGKILLYVRLPRTLASLVCGGALAVSGAVIQGVLANKLASPGIIGVNAGAGFAVTLCAALGIYAGWSTCIFAFAGAFLTVTAVSLICKKWGSSRSTVILVGVAVNSLLGALSDSIRTFFPEAGVMSNNFRIGEFSSVTADKLIPVLVVVTVAFLLLLSFSNELELFCMGEEQASSLGMNVSAMRTVFLFLAAMLAGAAVSIAGLLSFVGLIVPQIVRRPAENKAVHIITLSALYGGAFVSICDTLARTVFSPYEIPVGIIMSFLGAPFFICILVKGKGAHGRDRA